MIGDINFTPFNKTATFLINYYGPTSSIFKTFDRYSLSQVIDDENFDLSEMDYMSPDLIHLMVEAKKLSFADREEY